MIHSLQDTITLHNGVKMPGYGFGCWRTYDEETYRSVRWALDAGYRMIDTAARYENEEAVGRAVRDSGIPREEIFIVSKIWQTSFQNPKASIDASLRKLDLGYIDGFLLHWPGLEPELRYHAWEAMLNALEEKKFRCVGVSNFWVSHLKDLIARFGVVPVLNQIELHPWYMQKEVCGYCKEHEIALTAWGPIFRGHLSEVTFMEDLAKKYGRSAAQVTLRWHVQHDHVVIPKSTKQERILENAQIFDFSISEEDMAKIDALDCGKHFGKEPDTYDGAEWVLEDK